MPYLDKVVDVTVNLGTQPIDTVGFETPLFIAIHNNFTERARVYAELDQMVEVPLQITNTQQMAQLIQHFLL